MRQNPTARFVGGRAPRDSARWRPFSNQRLSPASQKQAVLVVKIVFEYLVGVRYLAGNPWSAVDLPKVPVAVNRMQIEKALAQPLWDELIERLEVRSNHPERIQDRVALAMMLLLGDSGLRRAEVASAQRIALVRSKWSSEVFELTVLGKRSAYRVVPVSRRTVDALRRHWTDRGLDFDATGAEGTLLSPVVVPSHFSATKRHRGNAQSGYTTDGLYKLFQSAIRRLKLDHTVDKGFSLDDLVTLSRASPMPYAILLAHWPWPMECQLMSRKQCWVTRTVRQLRSMCKQRRSALLKRAQNILRRSIRS